MRYHALACDFDGTIAHHGHVDADTIAALERVRGSGRRLLLVSGRVLEDLQAIFPRLDLFDRAVLENGALVLDPSTHAVRTLAEPPSPVFVASLERRGVRPLSIGRVVVATWQPQEVVVLDVIRELGLELQVIFNKGAVMVLPSGVNKAVGLRAALDELGLSPHNVVGVGDAENDHAFVSVCEFGVAVANALPMLKQRADWVTAGDHGTGVRELAAALLEDDLQQLDAGQVRNDVLIGHDDAGGAVTIHPYALPMLIAGTSGAGKSTLGTSLLEQLRDRDYQFCIVDPEGDYAEWEGVTHAGDGRRAPTVAEVLQVLAKPDASVVANLLGVPLADRPAYFTGLLARLLELRARTGRPHWILIDEAHHLLPRDLDTGALALPRDPRGLLLLTVHPESVAPAVLAMVATVIAIGTTPSETLAAFARAAGVEPPTVVDAPLAPGRGVVWWRHGRSGQPTAELRLQAPRMERRRHVRKYASGELAPEISFWFRGPEGRLNLRAQNLQVFMQLADGVDDETWTFHLRQGDVSRWFRECIKDLELVGEAERVAGEQGLPPAASRARIRAAIEQRYTAPE